VDGGYRECCGEVSFTGAGYFSESIIVFTSNLGIYRELPNGEREANVNPSMKYEEIEQRVGSEIENYFKYKLVRPEILNRLACPPRPSATMQSLGSSTMHSTVIGLFIEPLLIHPCAATRVGGL
jgi:hypothetical protein